jgi:hypothetical protein
MISQFRRKDDHACLRRHRGLRPRRTLRGSPAAGPRRAAGRGEAPPATCQARITAAAAAGGGQAVTSARAGAASYQQGPTYFGRYDG